MNNWVIKGSPAENEWDAWLKPGRNDHWHTRRPPRDWKKGDRLFFWESSPAKRIIATGELTNTGSRKSNGEHVYGVKYLTSRLRGMPTLAELRRVRQLNSASFLKAGPAASVHRLSTEQGNVLQKIISEKNPRLSRSARPSLHSGDSRDRNFLRTIALRVSKSLANKRYRGAFTPFDKPGRLRRTNTGGWKAIPFKLRSTKLQCHLWYDRFPAHPDRKLWYGIFSTNYDRLKDLGIRLEASFGKADDIGRSDITRDRDERYYLVKRREVIDFKTPVLERYGRNAAYWGFYVVTIPSDDHQLEVLIRKIIACWQAAGSAFADPTANPLLHPEIFEDDLGRYSGIEGKRRRVLHVVRERDPQLVRRKKARVFNKTRQLRCEACNFDFEETYGRLGKYFCEIHHKKALSKRNENEKTLLSDLAIMCSNCHRMIHKSGDPMWSVSRLRNEIERIGRKETAHRSS
jgi:hypothetical protein